MGQGPGLYSAWGSVRNPKKRNNKGMDPRVVRKSDPYELRFDLHTLLREGVQSRDLAGF